ncbi:MAG: protoporphyrinogen oxidase [Bryobacteraceae bacterium]|nr:protoporphyrinogen oxidase [Bryobacteraceae bacterium]
MDPVVIIGGGISGLSAAWYLKKAGIPSLVIEERNRLGGVIATDVVNGCVLEQGPDSFLSAKPAALELIRELGLAGDVIGSNDHQRVTYIRKNGRLVPLPDGLMMMVPTKIMPMVWSPLLSWPTKIRMGLELLRKPAPQTPPDRTVADFITDHYGPEAVDYLAEPLLSGVYGGAPERLSVRSVLTRFADLEAEYGSLTRGVLAARRKAGPQAAGTPLFRTLKGGLGSMIGLLEQGVAGSTRFLTASAVAVESSPEHRYRVKVGSEWISSRHVVVAAPAWAAASLVAPLDTELSVLLDRIEYSSSLTLALGYERATLDHPLNGFGFLVPRKERKLLVACTWVGTKFSHRVPPEWAVLRCFLGGAGNEAVLARSDEEIVATVREELREIMGVRAQPAFSRIARWPRSMAQYTVGHEDRIAAIRGRLARLPGLHLIGNAYEGIGIPDCVRMGRAAAESIARS